MNEELNKWLHEQLAKAEQAVTAREQMEKTMRGGSDSSWREVAKMTGTTFLTKARRIDNADRDARISRLCRTNVEMFKAAIAIVESQS